MGFQAIQLGLMIAQTRVSSVEGVDTAALLRDDDAPKRPDKAMIASSSSQPRSSPLKLLRRLPSAPPSLGGPNSGSSDGGRTRSSSFSYAGPPPTGPNGRPLKGCMKKTTTTHRCDDDNHEDDDDDDDAELFLRSRSHSNTRVVSFGHVRMREYSRKAGDNPSVSCGVPLTIGWEFNERDVMDIDTYEADRAFNSIDPAGTFHTRMLKPLPPRTRAKLLIEIGEVSRSQIRWQTMQAYRVWQQRLETLDKIGDMRYSSSVQMSKRERLFLVRESAARKLDRAMKGHFSDGREQRKLWDDAHEWEAARQQRSSQERQ
eukprot:CAMPEP_0181109844 /NCGR_PEP_ID=MMETSP1071-20121207/18394_1 /TAXON_ID=35127 /ORGANISM="Thalassiosira sp., Strain NH16" /LENGTH=315 /DNA_ID=CAMNT_0023193569 /DNA_START=89 /DNA_END=1036 /DNA_ORIENTATION=+